LFAKSAGTGIRELHRGADKRGGGVEVTNVLGLAEEGLLMERGRIDGAPFTFSLLTPFTGVLVADDLVLEAGEDRAGVFRDSAAGFAPWS
jgi:hypothetical protein